MKFLQGIFAIIFLVVSSYAQSSDGRPNIYTGAERGDATAQFNLARDYITKHKYSDAEKWLLKAAEQNHLDSQALLGKIYLLGMGNSENEANRDMAIKWLTKAATSGHADAQWDLGFEYYTMGRDSDAKKWIFSAAKQGEAMAQAFLGEAYFYGDALEGVRKNYKEAEKLLLDAAQQGLPAAQCALGRLYIRNKNYPEAYFWLNISTSANKLGQTEGCGLVARSVEHKPKQFMDRVEAFLSPAEILKIQERSLEWRPSNPLYEYLH